MSLTISAKKQDSEKSGEADGDPDSETGSEG